MSKTLYLLANPSGEYSIDLIVPKGFMLNCYLLAVCAGFSGSVAVQITCFAPVAS